MSGHVGFDLAHVGIMRGHVAWGGGPKTIFPMVDGGFWLAQGNDPAYPTTIGESVIQTSGTSAQVGEVDNGTIFVKYRHMLRFGPRPSGTISLASMSYNVTTINGSVPTAEVWYTTATDNTAAASYHVLTANAGGGAFTTGYQWFTLDPGVLNAIAPGDPMNFIIASSQELADAGPETRYVAAFLYALTKSFLIFVF